MIPDSSINPQLATMLVPFDAIFDTRTGTIARLGMDVFRGVQSSGYYSRTSDHFHGVDPEKYRTLYRERDAVTLSISPITHIVSFVKDFVRRVNLMSATSPIKKVPRVDINTYPFNTPDEVNERIRKALYVLIADVCDISFVSYSPEDLHYDLVKHTYDHMVFYEVGPWLMAQAEDWGKRKRAHSDLTVIMPVLSHEPDIKKVPKDIQAMADNFERDIAPLFNAIQVPVAMFCQIANPRSDAYTAPETKVPEADEAMQSPDDTDLVSYEVFD